MILSFPASFDDIQDEDLQRMTEELSTRDSVPGRSTINFIPKPTVITNLEKKYKRSITDWTTVVTFYESLKRFLTIQQSESLRVTQDAASWKWL